VNHTAPQVGVVVANAPIVSQVSRLLIHSTRRASWRLDLRNIDDFNMRAPRAARRATSHVIGSSVRWITLNFSRMPRPIRGRRDASVESFYEIPPDHESRRKKIVSTALEGSDR